jgi:hypothetical protein
MNAGQGLITKWLPTVGTLKRASFPKEVAKLPFGGGWFVDGSSTEIAVEVSFSW